MLRKMDRTRREREKYMGKEMGSLRERVIEMERESLKEMVREMGSLRE